MFQIDHPQLQDIAWFGLFIFVWCLSLSCYTAYSVHSFHNKKK